MQVFPIGNISERPQDSFYMEPEGLFRTLVVLDDHGWDVLGTYHSHPPGSRTDPSPRDRLSASYPGSLQVIIVPGRNEDLGIIRAFDLAMGRPVEVPIVVAESLTPLRTTKRNLRGLNYQSKE